MGILQRYECQQFALDEKKTLFGLTVNGVSAFDVMSRPILLCELFATGEDGDIGIGLIPSNARTDRMPGNDYNSIAFRGNDGGIYHSSEQPVATLEKFSAGDVVGCGMKRVGVH